MQMCQHTQVQPRQRRLASRLHTSLCLLCTSVRHARSDTKKPKAKKEAGHHARPRRASATVPVQDAPCICLVAAYSMTATIPWWIWLCNHTYVHAAGRSRFRGLPGPDRLLWPCIRCLPQKATRLSRLVTAAVGAGPEGSASAKHESLQVVCACPELSKEPEDGGVAVRCTSSTGL